MQKNAKNIFFFIKKLKNIASASSAEVNNIKKSKWELGINGGKGVKTRRGGGNCILILLRPILLRHMCALRETHGEFKTRNNSLHHSSDQSWALVAILTFFHSEKCHFRIFNYVKATEEGVIYFNRLGPEAAFIMRLARR